MKKTLLSACLAALMFPACNDTSGSPLPVGRASPPIPQSVVRGAPKPVIASRTPKLVVVDAGTLEDIPELVDVLAVAHEHRGREDHLARARSLREEGDLASALLEARRALHDLPDDDEALAMVARLGGKTGARALAAEAYARIARLHSEDPMPLIQQARLLLSLGKQDEAILAAKDALARDGQNPESHQALGRAYLMDGDLRRAIDSFERVVALAPEHGHGLNNLGFAYLRANENTKALEVLTRAAERLPHVAYVHNNLGVALSRQGRTEDARQAFGRATSLSPKYVKARINFDRVAVADTQTATDASATDASATDGEAVDTDWVFEEPTVIVPGTPE